MQPSSSSPTAAIQSVATLVESIQAVMTKNASKINASQATVLKCTLVYLLTWYSNSRPAHEREDVHRMIVELAKHIDFAMVSRVVARRPDSCQKSIPVLNGALFWHTLHVAGADHFGDETFPPLSVHERLQCVRCRAVHPGAFYLPTTWVAWGVKLPLCRTCLNTLENSVVATGTDTLCAGCGRNAQTRERSGVHVCTECVPTE